jgi:pilus assembly protein Flp/PilA
MLFFKFLKARSGATAIEYGLISAIMALALLSGYSAFSSAMNNQFQYIATTVTDSWPD